MKIVFFGTGAYGTEALQALAASCHSVVLVIASADKPRGRNLKTESSPIKEAAKKLNLPVHIYDPSRKPETLERVRSLEPDFLVVVSFGFMLPKDLLSSARIASLNIHPSILPRHRGASPMPWTILEGDAETGVSVISMNERMDAGDIAAQVRTPIHADEDLPALEKRLSKLGAMLIVETLDNWEAGRVHPIPQDDVRATYTKKFSKEDAHLDFTLTAFVLARRVRALKGWPGTFALLRGKRILVHSAVAVEGLGSPGAVLRSDGEGIEVATAKGALSMRSVQLEGKNQMPVKEFLRGFPVKPGDMFE